MSGPLLLAVESSCDETAIALVEDGRRIHANVVASQVALHAPTGGIVPEVAARAHLRWIVPVLDEALATAGVTMKRCRRGGGHVRPRPRGLAAGRRQLRQGARLGARQAAGARQPPRGTRLRGLAAGPGRGRARPAAVPAGRAGRLGRAHVPGRDARPPRLPATSAARSTTPPARRSTRSGGCWASATRAGRRSRWRPRMPWRRTGSSRGPGCATTYDCQLLRPQDGRAPDHRRRRGPMQACRPTSGRAPLPGGRRRRARLGLPGLRGGRAGDEDDPGGRGDRRPRHRAGWRRRGQRRAAGAGSRRGGGSRASRWSSRGRACAPTTAR